MTLTCAYITSRLDCHIEWFFDSLRRQLKAGDKISVIVVDFYAELAGRKETFRTLAKELPLVHVEPKPTIWQGKHRITSEDWWAMSNATNTAFCLCRDRWIACLDDRSVLLPGWLLAVRRAIRAGYGVCGSYEKVHNLIVENGEVKNYTEPRDTTGNPTGKDSRLPNLLHTQLNDALVCPGEWFFGCSFALPMEWIFAVNGTDETCDGISMQDCIFGLQLKNNGFPLCFDPRMKIIEDRTPDQLGRVMRREDKGVSPNDKSHAMLAMLRDEKRTRHDWDLKSISLKLLEGEPWPIPEAKKYVDWYDGEEIGPDYMKGAAA